ncbi:hypothetical protein B296_00010481 [Ensete ventricosum]|uniref:X8 domain-containing protein n=1 Tax=Ensete ventricosum TaxID=4639 RepID=A0A427A5M2_ENSVE|nr:hypothetical protein B296_00010481 [Ensete ventricosum]
MHTHPCQHRNYGTDERTGGRGPHPHLPRYVMPHAGPLFRTHAHQTICLASPPAPPKNQSGRRAVRDERVGAAISDRTFVLDQAEQCFEMRARKGVGADRHPLDRPFMFGSGVVGCTTVLQKTLDYACGAGADCTPILQNGACYNPNTVLAHCSYAANSYYQRKGQTQDACDFAATATLSSTDPGDL